MLRFEISWSVNGLVVMGCITFIKVQGPAAHRGAGPSQTYHGIERRDIFPSGKYNHYQLVSQIISIGSTKLNKIQYEHYSFVQSLYHTHTDTHNDKKLVSWSSKIIMQKEMCKLSFCTNDDKTMRYEFNFSKRSSPSKCERCNRSDYSVICNQIWYILDF